MFVCYIIYTAFIVFRQFFAELFKKGLTDVITSGIVALSNTEQKEVPERK